MSNYLLKNYSRFNLTFTQGQGATLVSEDGKQYIDFSSGIGVNSIGHGHQEFVKALSEQMSNIIHVSNLYNIQPQEELAKQISKLAGFELFSFFANSGAEANESAIKLARKYGSQTGKYKIITLENSFHGRTYGSLSATAQTSLHRGFSPMLNGFSYAKNIADIYNLIDSETVAVMIELIQGEGGVEALPKDEVQQLAHYLKSNDILLIVDEVQTGIYRTGKFLASNIYDLKPDIITLAKGLGGGVPIGVMATQLKDGFSVGDHGSTFGGNFLSTVAGLKVLEILEREYQSGELNKRIELFNSKLENILNKYSNIFYDIQGIGLMRGLTLNKNIELSDILTLGHENGILLLKSGKNRLRFLPPLTISEDEIQEGFIKIETILKDIKERNF